MKLLIADIRELQSYLSFSNSITFDKVKPHVERMHRERIKPLLGTALYDELASAYETAGFKVNQMDEKYQDVVQYLQDAITNISFLAYTAQGQLILGSSGLRLAVNENEKTAFQWQIEDFKYQLGLDGFNALDRVLLHLEDKKADFPNWSDSDAYYLQKQYLVDTATKFDKGYYINNSRMTYLTIRYIMHRIEQHVVKKMFGFKLFNTLKAHFTDAGLTDAEKYLLAEHLEPGITLLTVAKGVVERALNLLDAGVSVNLYSYYANLKLNERTKQNLDDKLEMIEQLQTDGTAFLQAGKDYVEANKDLFPDYEASDEPSAFLKITNNEDRKFFGV